MNTKRNRWRRTRRLRFFLGANNPVRSKYSDGAFEAVKTRAGRRRWLEKSSVRKLLRTSRERFFAVHAYREREKVEVIGSVPLDGGEAAVRRHADGSSSASRRAVRGIRLRRWRLGPPGRAEDAVLQPLMISLAMVMFEPLVYGISQRVLAEEDHVGRGTRISARETTAR